MQRRLSLLTLVVAVFLLGSAALVQAQGTFTHGTVVALQGTPHLWFADEHGVLHWGGDTRALAGKHIAWSNRVEVSLDQLRTLPVGDPWLSAGLLKDGDPIYLVKWETDWPQPQLLHIQSIKDVELFGINGSNYGNFVIDRPAWEQRYGISAAGLQRGVLASAVTGPVPTSVSTPTATPAPARTPLPTPTTVPHTGDWQFREQTDAFTGEVTKSMYLVAHTRQGYGTEFPELILRCTVEKKGSLELLVWWKEYIGSTKGVLTSEDSVHPVEHRIDGGSVSKWEWNPSTHQNSSFAPRWTVRALLTADLTGKSVTFRYYKEPSEVAIRVTRYDKTTITGVWRTIGAETSFERILSQCGLSHSAAIGRIGR